MTLFCGHNPEDFGLDPQRPDLAELSAMVGEIATLRAVPEHKRTILQQERLFDLQYFQLPAKRDDPSIPYEREELPDRKLNLQEIKSLGKAGIEYGQNYGWTSREEMERDFAEEPDEICDHLQTIANSYPKKERMVKMAKRELDPFLKQFERENK